MRAKRRFLSVLLTVAMLVSVISQTAFAAEAESDSITRDGEYRELENQQESDEEHGHGEMKPEHRHTDACYTDVVNCLHEHTEECYPPDEESDDEATPSNAKEKEPTECGHICDWENGCIVRVLDCGYEDESEDVYEDEELEEELEAEATPSDAWEVELESGCICTERCTEDNINEDCPVCGAEDADLELCEGEEILAQTLMALKTSGNYTVTYGWTTTGYDTFSAAWYAARMQPGAVLTMYQDYTRTNSNETLSLNSGESFTLDLNGHTVDVDRDFHYESLSFSAISIYGNFTLTDSSTDDVALQGKITGCYANKEGGGIDVASSAKFTMYGGNITGNKSENAGAGVDNKGTFEMYGGSITNNSVITGQPGYAVGGVHNAASGTFIMHGGVISGNRNVTHGGGVCNQGEFIMDGGVIKGNKTTTGSGGGVANKSVAGKTATFTMSGGDITDNNASASGGGLYCADGEVTVTSDGDGIIKNNTAQWGGGIYVDGGRCTLDGARVTGNTAYKSGGGVCLNKGEAVLQNDTVIVTNQYSNYGYWDNNLFVYNATDTARVVVNSLGADAYIGFSTQTKPTDGKPVLLGDCNTNEEIDSSKLFSDDEQYRVYVDAGKLYLGTPVHIHTGGTATCHTLAICSGCGQAYGEVDPDKHDGGTEVRNKVDATCTKAGNTGDTYCKGCGVKISDGKILEALGHTGGTATCQSPAICIRCGQTYGDKDSSNHTGKTEVRGAKEATCTEAGYTGDTYCLGCGVRLIEGNPIAAHGHTGGTATCHSKVICTKCNQPYGEYDPNNHTGGEEVRDAKEATCTEAGYTGDTYCKGCEAKLSKGEPIEALGHIGGTATCQSPAICTRCEQPYGELAPNNHDGGTEVRGAKDATCTEAGYTGTTYCKGCEAELSKGEPIKALGHTGGTATCHAKAICTRCNQPYGELAPNNHDGGTEVRGAKDATCTEAGYTGDTYCKGCNEKISGGEPIEALDHTGGTATCHAKAICTRCKQPYGETDPNNHDGETEVRGAKAATCTEAGYTGDTYCKGCNEKISGGEPIEALDHTGGTATCHAKAICTRCKQPYGETDPNNHDGETEVRGAKAATCTEAGYTGDTYCKGCKAELSKGEPIEALGHTGGTATCHAKAICTRCNQPYGEFDPNNHDGEMEVRGAKDATCTEVGYTGDTYCKGCEAKLSGGEPIKVLGHTGGTATCHAKAICIRCDQPYGELDLNNHTGGTEVRGAKEATKTSPGYTGDTYCLGCGTRIATGEVIPKLAPSIVVPVTGDSNMVEVGAEINGSTATIDKIEAEEIREVLTGNDATGEVKIDLSWLDQKISEVNLPVETVKAVQDAAEQGAGGTETLVIRFSTGTVTLDNRAMQAAVEQAEGDELQLVLNDVEPGHFNSAQRSAIQGMDVRGGVEAYLLCTQTGKRISDFEGGAATLQIPFAIPAGQRAEGFSVWYVDENGGKTKHETTYRNGHLIWKVGHFSDYVIVYEAVKGNTGAGSVSGSSSDNGGSGRTADLCVWRQDEKGWWIEKPDGSYPANIWFECMWNGKIHWYHFNAEGYLESGWFTDTDGQTYFLHDIHDGGFGYMYTGWNWIGGKCYYFNPETDQDGKKKGALLKNTRTPDGYQVDPTGAWVENGVVQTR